ncbi:DUF423 domain-containing protein [Polycladidibacter hongkongensis]|uniref:DUF423 domain-containing protein n=1 Tax=Polycladidibacter hongkongensis TaxID=1647556 RepID=UPI000832EAE4|nr:DUF423 domain-containing protein [Pseudovibrio hongkongensis]
MRIWAATALFASGLSGAVGVLSAAAAAHGDGAYLGLISQFTLTSALAYLGLAWLLQGQFSRMFQAALIAMVVGELLFCGDLAVRLLSGERMFYMAAPTGGIAMAMGWLFLSVGAVVCAFRKPE